MLDQILTPSDFIGLLNQTLEFAYPKVVIEGELSNLRVSKNRWVYFNLADENSSVPYFGTVYQLPGPLEDGLMVRAVGSPRMHARFGFSVNLDSLVPTGEGSLKKAAELLRRKLEAEGLFAPERKRLLPFAPVKIGLITAAGSAAYTDFIKITGEKWGGLEINLSDVYVQGDQAPVQIMTAIEHFNQMSEVMEVLVITRGGGSADDLAAFNDERVIRAIAGSRIPTLVAIGHEVDVSLAELAADQRASTPTNAAQVLVPDKIQIADKLNNLTDKLTDNIDDLLAAEIERLARIKDSIISGMTEIINIELDKINSLKKLILLFNPELMLKRGYAIIQKNGRQLKSVKSVNTDDSIDIKMYDGRLKTLVTKVEKA